LDGRTIQKKVKKKKSAGNGEGKKVITKRKGAVTLVVEEV